MSQLITSEPSSSLDSHPEKSSLEVAQLLAEKLSIGPNEWHRLKGNRKARAAQQAAAALVFLLKDKPEEALTQFQQVVGWLDKSITAPPCPSHGPKKVTEENKTE